MDVIKRIVKFNAGRDPVRLRLKYVAMRASPLGFLRGSCHLFVDRLPGGLPKTPVVWICGDLHVENFGAYKDGWRVLRWDINDFDDAALAPAAWDLLRLLTSLLLGAAAVGLGDAAAQALCRTFTQAYAAALAVGKAGWVDRDTAGGPVRELLDALQLRRRPAFLDRRTVRKGSRRRLLVDGGKALPAPAAERDELTAFMHDFALAQPDPGFFQLLDVARRIAGTGSLGVARWTLLVEGRGSPDGNFLLDLKQALPSAWQPRLQRLNAAQPHWADEAARVVALQRRMQAASSAFLHAVRVGEVACVLRGLEPSEDRLSLKQAGARPDGLAQLVAEMARCTAWAQLRSSGREGSAIADELIDFGGRKGWQARLIEAAQACAERTRADAAIFNAAFDSGVLDG